MSDVRRRPADLDTRVLGAVARQALTSYQLRPRRVRLAAHAFNTIFRVATDANVFALRVGASLSFHPPRTAAIELEWARRLQQSGLPVPSVIPNDAGEAATIVDDVDGQPRTCVLFDWVHGRRPSGRVGSAYARELGRVSAHLHRDAEGWSLPAAPPVLVADTVLYWPLPDRLPAAGSRYGSIFDDARGRAQEAIDTLWQDPPHPPRLLHGDLHPWNTIRVPGGAVVPIDFQDLIWGFDIQDLVITVAALRRHAGGDNLREPFSEGYREVRSLPEISPEGFESLAVARGLNQVNLTLNNLVGDHSRYLAAHAARLRAWLDN